MALTRSNVKDRGLITQLVFFAIGMAFFASVFAADETGVEEPVAASTEPSFEQAVQLLDVSNFKEKLAAVETLAGIDHPQTLPLLKALLDNDVYRRKNDDRIVIATRAEDVYQLTDATTGEALGTAEKSTLKKIVVNNKMRSLLSEAIARINLTSKEAGIRLLAVQNMLSDMDEKTATLMRELLDKETNTKVKAMMQTAIAIVDVNSDEKFTRISAIQSLSNSIEPEAKNVLTQLLAKNPEDEFIEADADVRAAAKSALNSIQSSLDFYHFIETTFFGLSLGSVLLLAAIGLAITFGVMGVINMAHGELIMLGAYTTYVIQQLMPNNIGISVLIAIPAAFIVAGLVGIAIERGVIRFLYGRPLETLLATFGISLVLQQLVRSIFSPLNRSVETPAWMSGTWEINSALSLTYNRLYIVLFSIIVFFALLLVLKKTVLGLQVRAVAQNRPMARAMGVRSEWVDALTFGLGSGIAGVAGVALSQLTNVGPNMGQGYIIDSFMVVVFGGVGNLWGTFVGAMSLGVVNKYLEPYSGAVMAKILVLVFIILFIQKRPRGLFPQKGRAAEN
ncbi:MAG: urea ABC transporter permease subunit UrtB [Gammaproteobacteria bacterium]|jgi:urea transport system permease protein|nr:urea ABC transporter permease subunit UrtB [Gammaproteobacteria bacterium]